tara:strand:- start:2807 stop:3124 length:318 start_codon:yes stop_codon:yes gene_type:complete
MSRIKIGSIGVDAGMCFIGDPCYTLPDDASQRTILDVDGNDLWNRIIKAMANKLYTSMSYITKNRFNEYAEGLGVCVTTGHGDGEYPVYAEIEDGVVKSVTIKFV